MAKKTNKKTTPRNTKPKKIVKKRNTKKNQASKKTILTFSFILLFAFSATIASYFLITSKENSNKNIIENKIAKEETKEIKLPKYEFEEITKEFDIDYEHHPKIDKEIEKQKKVEKEIKPNELKPKEVVISQKEIIEQKTEEPKVKKEITKETLDNKKPKLAIIIDDITTNYQVKKAKEVGYTINLSFLPPTDLRPYSAKVAKSVPYHMIHLPLEASPNFKSQEAGVLNVNDSYEKIENRIKTIRDLFPNANYINNHTGSVFTQDDKSMDKLFKALTKYNFTFVDSRTSPNSVAKKYALKYNQPYIVRNTFIDNKKDKKYIKNQLLKAIEIAKKNGFAIAIGHPYKETFEVLKESKEILKEIQAIYINQL